MSILELWLMLEVIPSLGGMFAVLATCFSVGYAVMLLISSIVYSECQVKNEPTVRSFQKKTLSNWKIFAVATVLSVVISSVAPNKETTLTIVGAHYASNIKGIDEVPEAAVGAFNKFLKTYAEGE